jgi:hypothetical protein
MLNIIRSLAYWRHYLEGAHHEFEIWNDHANLQWFMKHPDLNRRQARWAQYLSRFNFKWLHKAGATMGKTDSVKMIDGVGLPETLLTCPKSLGS